MRSQLKQTLDFYQKGLITKEEFKKLVGFVSENKICKLCGEEFSQESEDKFCQECQNDMYLERIENDRFKWAEESDKDQEEQEERHDPLEKAVEDINFE